ncbi:hypothetical protein [Bradyrhizobium sp. JYMT SZCCT0180]|uniref:hypothetical protein n=1 Tax=Bradyrhizobium sp. JYMT SZCCT0180 TaxID=2807666 RepID=UPI002012A5BD|nr:hypothetical protein [Bradyrhizobium sp. JYMT SZCCT0180]
MSDLAIRAVGDGGGPEQRCRLPFGNRASGGDRSQKKMHYRPTMLKSRDIFDIAVADSIDHEALVGNLHEISDKQNALRKRLDAIDPKFLQAELAELDIQEGWDDQKKNCLETVQSLVEQIP